MVGHEAGRQQHVIVEFVDLAGRHDGRQEIQDGRHHRDDDRGPGECGKSIGIPDRPTENPAGGTASERETPEDDQDGRSGQLRHRDDLDGEAGRLNPQQYGHDRAERRGKPDVQQPQQQQAETHAAHECRQADQEDDGRRIGVLGEDRGQGRNAAGRSLPIQTVRRANRLK